MRKIIVSIIAVAMTTTPAFAISKKASEASVGSAKGASNMSVQVLKNGSAFSGKLAEGSFEFSYQAGKMTSDLVIKGVATSGKVSTVVLTKASDLGQSSIKASGKAFSSVINASGTVIKASLDSTGKAIQIVVDSTGQVLAWGSKQVVGSAKFSIKASKTVGKFFLNAAGQILDFSGQVVGTVINASGQVVKFVADSAGKMFDASIEVSTIVITASSKLVSKALKLSGKAVKAIVYGIGDVTFTVIATSAAFSKATSEGRFLKASEVLIYLPANMLAAALYSDMHYQKLMPNN